MDAASSAIADIADFVRIIKEDPEWADTVRGILLGQDLLELPARFNELVATLAENNRLVRARLAMLEQQFERLDSNLDDFKQETRTRFDKLEGELGQLVGTDLERKVHANAVTYLTRLLDLHGKTRILKSAFIPMQDELHELLFEAAELSEAQIERIGLTDVVLSGQHQGRPVYVTIEVSHTTANHDIERAADSARFMRAASGRTTIPVVIGCYMAKEQRQQAQRLNVAVRIIKAG